MRLTTRKLKSLFIVLAASFLLSGCSSTEILSLEGVEELYQQKTSQQISLAPQQGIDLNQLLRQPLTAKNAIQITLLENHDLTSLYHNMGIRQADLIQAGLLKNPVVEISTLFSSEAAAPNLTLAFITSLSSLIERPLRQEIAANELEIEKMRLAAEMIAFSSKTHMAYISHRTAVTAVSLARENTRLDKAALTLAKGLLEAGNISKYDYETRLNRLELSRAREMEVKSRVKQTRAALNSAMGLDQTSAGLWRTPAGIPALPHQKLHPEATAKRALSASLDIAIAREELIIFGLKNQLERRQNLIPDLDLGVEFERNDGEKEVGPVAEITIPLFDHGQAKRIKAHHQLAKMESRLTAIMRKVVLNALRLSRLHNSRANLRRHYHQAILPGSKRLQKGALENYNAMQEGAFALLRAKQQDVELRARLLSLKSESWMGLIELKALLEGRLINNEGIQSALEPPLSGSPDMEEGH